jgi:hypothetical protein
MIRSGHPGFRTLQNSTQPLALAAETLAAAVALAALTDACCFRLPAAAAAVVQSVQCSAVTRVALLVSRVTTDIHYVLNLVIGA